MRQAGLNRHCRTGPSLHYPILTKIPLPPTPVGRPFAHNHILLPCMTWLQLGGLRTFLAFNAGLHLHLESLRIRQHEALAEGAHFMGNVLVDPSAKIGRNCLVGPDVSIGQGCEIGDGVRLSRCVVMRGVTVANYAKVSDTIIGWGSRIGKWSRVENTAILGEDVGVKVRPNSTMNGCD